MSTLDAKKKKLIQQIRTMLNDYPSVHPLAHKVLISSTYRVLKDLHLQLLGLDGHNSRATKALKNTKQVPIVPKSAPNSQAKELIDDCPEEILSAFQRAARLNARRIPSKDPYELAREQEQDKRRRRRRRLEKDPLEAILNLR